MARRYWLDLFTGETWEEFLNNGANVSGFRERRKKIAQTIEPGDYLICYITGISRFVGVLEVKSKCYIDKKPIWKNELFPYRFDVELIYKLDPKTGLPVHELKDKLSIPGLKTKNWSGFFRGSPTEFRPEDGQIILQTIRDTINNPIEREYDQKKYLRHPRTYESKVGIVTIPEESEETVPIQEELSRTSHEEIQWLLLQLGSDLGLDVWVARNDRSKQYNGMPFQNIPRLKKELPRQFDEVTNRTIELIDVLWLQGDAILAAFEVEHTTAIYSGLLRMADLVSMQPNIKLDLYLVAPDERNDKVLNEINRPTFKKIKPSLPSICKFIPYSKLKKETEQIGHRAKFMKPEFIREIAESCEVDEA
jgi:predicted RNA-binding protein